MLRIANSQSLNRLGHFLRRIANPPGRLAEFGQQVADQIGRKIFHLDMGQKIVALKLLPNLGSNFKEIYNMKRLTSEYPDFPILYEDIRYKFTKKNEMRIDFLIILTKNITEWLSLAICHGFLCRIHYI